MSGDILDSELLTLQNRLKTIQKEIGGAKEKASVHDGKLDRFLDLYSQMSERLDVIHTSVEEIRKLTMFPGANPTDLIALQSKVRSELNALGDEYKEFEMLQRLESKKRRSRYNPQELADRQEKVVYMQTNIQEIKDVQRAGFAKAYTATRLIKMEDSDMFKRRDVEMGAMGTETGGRAQPGAPPPQQRGVYGQRNNDMTDQHRLQLMRIKERDTQVVRIPSCPPTIYKCLIDRHAVTVLYLYVCRMKPLMKSVKEWMCCTRSHVRPTKKSNCKM
jgi:hypothetical protein